MADDLLLLRGTDYLLLRGTDRLILRAEVPAAVIDIDIKADLQYRNKISANLEYRTTLSSDLVLEML